MGLDEHQEGGGITNPLKEKARWSMEQVGEIPHSHILSLRGSHCSEACAFWILRLGSGHMSVLYGLSWLRQDRAKGITGDISFPCTQEGKDIDYLI